ncbi:MAG: peptide chain release factor N(5)-glutamine methyltransferase [Acidobacteria bacterium]|nr:peptide chain release factor N(5)-glutamine methyltransferase [Acidobacteriota bacterium]
MQAIEAIREGLAVLQAAGCSEPYRDAELLLMQAAGWTREHLYRDLQDPIGADVLDEYRRLIGRRQSREPISYIRGVKEFAGLEFDVTPDVLIPRPETELIVEKAIELAPRGGVLADAGTGSGNIAVAVAFARGDLRVIATDISPAAIAVALGNARKHGVKDHVRLVRTSLLQCFRASCLDLVASNPPYVATGDDQSALMEEVRAYEPAVALYAGKDGLTQIRILIQQAAACLKPGGWFLMELGMGQGRAILDMLDGRLWDDASLLEDLRGIQRVLKARKRP